jgi:hypothetical protein
MAKAGKRKEGRVLAEDSKAIESASQKPWPPPSLPSSNDDPPPDDQRANGTEQKLKASNPLPESKLPESELPKNRNGNSIDFVGRCASCGKSARKDCTQHLCVKCCTDDACAIHTEQRKKSIWKQEVMTATTPLQLQAQWKRSQMIKPSQKRLIKEPNFTYLGDTVVIWNIRECLQNPKKPSLAEDILRKASKRKMLQDNCNHHKENILRNNRKRFRTVMEGLYQRSITQEEAAAAAAAAAK